MYLSELKTGENGIIVKVVGQRSFRKRLIEMGFIPGKRVTAILNAPLKDPIEYEILGYRLSLRRSEASLIEVVGEEEAKQNMLMEVGEATGAYDDEGDEIAALNLRMAELADKSRRTIRCALVGNPNCGKTSLFNMASGAHEHVGNYSGVTVDAKEGHFSYKGYDFIFVDLPGTYSLSAYSPEELYVRKNLVEHTPDIVINVVDASNIERNLYLTTQLIDMNLRMVMALNMFDELRSRGDKIDLRQLGYLLGMPVCPTVSRDGEGISEMLDTVIRRYEHFGNDEFARHIHIPHGTELELSISRIRSLIRKNPDIINRYSTRYLAIKALEGDKDIDRVLRGLSNYGEIAQAVSQEDERITGLLKNNAESSIVDAKYAFIQGALKEVYVPHIDKAPRRTVTDRIDAVVTNKWMAFPIFILLLYLVFQTTFAVGQYPMDWIDALVSKFGELVGNIMQPGWIRDVVVDGVIAGVGSVLVFLPNILILYFFLSLMEDSGYMARAAFIVDRLMHKLGLHGKSFIPMVMGFGCNVPAIMATRAIESPKSRLITIAILPFMSCAGRLPIFVLLAGAFFPKHAGLALLGIYLLGILLAILSALILKRFIKDDNLPFVMELPPYRVPTSKAIWRHTWEKGKQYLQKMATTILIGSVIIWGLGYFPRSDKGQAYQQEHSYIGQVGKAIEPAFEPLGFSWKEDIGLITGVVAKELVVSSLGVMYAGDEAAADVSLETGAPAVSEAPVDSSGADGDETALQAALLRNISLPAAVAFMIFVLLYFPCIATFVAIKNETGKWSWAIAICAYTIILAWVVAFIGFHLTSLLM